MNKEKVIINFCPDALEKYLNWCEFTKPDKKLVKRLKKYQGTSKILDSKDDSYFIEIAYQSQAIASFSPKTFEW